MGFLGNTLGTCRMGGRVVEGTGLENQQGRKALGGSNPSPSASILAVFLFIFMSFSLSAVQMRTSARAYETLKEVEEEVSKAFLAAGSNTQSDLILVIYKQAKSGWSWTNFYRGEAQLWGQKEDGKYNLVKKFSIIHYPGEVGPPTVDKPENLIEGVYAIGAQSLNPLSKNFLSIRIQAPNLADKHAHRPAFPSEIHGGWFGQNGFALGKEGIKFLYSSLYQHFQESRNPVQVMIFPFPFQEEFLYSYRRSPHLGFWDQLMPMESFFRETQKRPRFVTKAGKYYWLSEISREALG